MYTIISSESVIKHGVGWHVCKLFFRNIAMDMNEIKIWDS